MALKSTENETQKRYNKPRFHASVRVLIVFVLLVIVFYAGWASHRVYAIVQSEIEGEQQFQQTVEAIREIRAGQVNKKTGTRNLPNRQ